MSKIIPLGEIAQVSLGYKSLQNDFFYLNESTIDTYGIEDEYLTSMIRFRDLDAGSYLQKPTPTTWLFQCRKKEGDLRGTGAFRYISGMAAGPAKRKKQSGKATTIQEALEAQGGGLWYGPKASPHAAHIWLRKACNSIYAPFIFAAPAVLDQRCNYIQSKAGIAWELVAAVVTSTLFGFSLEINGSASMGAGALEAPTTKLRQYPVFDPRTLTDMEKQQLTTLARAVWKDETPIDWIANPAPGPRLEALDGWLLKQIESGITTTTLYSDLAEACAGRIAVAHDRAHTTKKKQIDNLTNVAQGIVDQVRPLLNARRFPDNFLPESSAVVPITVDRQSVRRINLECFLDQTTLTLSDDHGKPFFKETYNAAIAEAFVRAILLGRESFSIPADRATAATAVSEFLAWFDDIRLRLKAGIDESAFGTGYERRLATEVYQRLGIDSRAGERVLPPNMTLAAS